MRVSTPSPPSIIVLLVKNPEFATNVSELNVPDTGAWSVGIEIAVLLVSEETSVNAPLIQVLSPFAS